MNRQDALEEKGRISTKEQKVSKKNLSVVRTMKTCCKVTVIQNM